MKKIILFILLSISVSSFAQEKQSYAIYCFDSSEVKKIEQTFLKADYLQSENDSLFSLVRNLDLKIMNLKSQNIALNDVIHYKDLQLVKLENEPKEIIKQSNYTIFEIGFISIGSAAIGYALARILTK